MVEDLGVKFEIQIPNSSIEIDSLLLGDPGLYAIVSCTRSCGKKDEE
jgi:hypothetical protein